MSARVDGRACGVAVRHWRAPRLSDRKLVTEPDGAAKMLEQIARCALASASGVLKDVVAASHGPVQCEAYLDVPETEDRAWRILHPDIEAYCVCNAQSERHLLGLIIGALPRHRPSEIERRIVGEAVTRLFTPPRVRVEIREELRSRPSPPTWRCPIELQSADGHAAELSLFTACLPPPLPALVRPALHDVPLVLRAALPTVSYDLATVSKWECGSLVGLKRLAGDPVAFLYAGGRRMARAQLGSLFGDRALKLTELIADGA